MRIYGLEREVMDLEVSYRDKSDICERLLEINRAIIPCSSDRAERIYKRLCALFAERLSLV